MTIDASTGAFSWTPSQLQGGATYPVTITVTDNGTNPVSLTDSQTFDIAVNEVNEVAASLSGVVFDDLDNDGTQDAGELGMGGVVVELFRLMASDAQGVFEFTDLRPGVYALLEDQPSGYADGGESRGTINGVPTGVVANDQFTALVLPRPGSDAVNYNFGERPQAGGQIQDGQTATIGFWQNKHGQSLMKSLNGGPASTQLGNWLAATFPNMYGHDAGSGNLAGKTNAAVADVYTSLFKRNGKTTPGGPPKLDAQVLAVALAVYVTNENLAGTTAASYGFQVTAEGVGTCVFTVGDNNRQAFGLAPTDNNRLSVLDILLATDRLTRKGLLYDLDGDGNIDNLERTLRVTANDVFAAINEMGGV